MRPASPRSDLRYGPPRAGGRRVAILLATLFAASCTCGGKSSGGSPPGNTGDGGMSDGGGEPCVANCVGRTCGSDGCGGSCGKCTTLAAPVCNETAGRCVAECTPQCAGKNCGSDGCGGLCGTCTGALACTAAGVCAPAAWTCDPVRYAARDQCDCGCGAPDPDCADKQLLTAGCGPTEHCGSDGKCSPNAPSSWTCSASVYGARDACDCGCGAVDPDCANGALPVRGCVGRNATCKSDGTCACTPSCGTNVCGDNGCGGSCGTCSDPAKSICLGGACVSACDPTPIRCHFAACGSNECGGSCGTCAPGSSCADGACVTTLANDPLSCFGQCGNLTAGACSCAPDCTAKGTCCADYPNTCGNCFANCGGRACGPDGCGGSCGSCGSGAVCSAGVCISGCHPACAGRQCGDDGCGGSCGACASGSLCQWTGECVPVSWFCDVSEYGDGTACHCGCGASDPNCKDASAPVFGCANGASTCSSAGLCSDKSCAADGECGTGRLCAGTYYQGNARFAGTCGAAAAGGAVGQSCDFGGSCATGVCAEGLCRRYCAKDTDCPGDQQCVALPLKELGGAIEGFVSVCELIPAWFGTCAKQADCPQQACVARLGPTTLAPLYECANASTALGSRCDAASCPAGQLCAPANGPNVCTLPCPGGNADCPNGWHCGSMTFRSAGFTSASSAPVVPVCLPN